jgi:hypothetical protein
MCCRPPSDLAAALARLSRDREAEVIWERAYGGERIDAARGISVLGDGSLALAARSRSAASGRDEVWMLFLAADGTPRTERRFGGLEFERAAAMAGRPDGTLAVVGSRGDREGARAQAWIAVFDRTGARLWEKTLGVPQTAQSLAALAVAGDGALVVAGSTTAKGAGGFDAWVLRLDRDGAAQWEKTFGGAGEDSAYAVGLLPGGDIAVAGYTESKGAGGGDGWLARLDAQGGLRWERAIGGRDYDVFNAIAATADGGLVVAGHTRSKGPPGGAGWVVRFDDKGNALWERLLAGPDGEWGWLNSVVTLADGGFVVAGFLKKGEFGDEQALIARLDGSGNVLWRKVMGGAGDDNLLQIVPLADGGFAAAGFTSSKGGGQGDVWVVRLGYPAAAKK